MAITKTVTQILTVTSLAGGAESAAGTSVNLVNDSLVALTVKLTYDAAATVGADLKVYAGPDGTSWDTDAYHTESLPFVAGQVKQRTFTLTPAPAYIKTEVKNLDGTRAITTITVKIHRQQVA